MSIEERVNERKRQIFVGESVKNRQQYDVAINNARSLHSVIRDRVVDALARTGNKSVVGSIESDFQFHDYQTKEEGILLGLFRKSVKISQKGFIFSRNVYTITISRADHFDWAVFCSEFNKNIHSDGIVVDWYIAIDYPDREMKKIDIDTFSEYTTTVSVPNIGRGHRVSAHMVLKFSFKN